MDITCSMCCCLCVEVVFGFSVFSGNCHCGSGSDDSDEYGVWIVDVAENQILIIIQAVDINLILHILEYCTKNLL